MIPHDANVPREKLQPEEETKKVISLRHKRNCRRYCKAPDPQEVDFSLLRFDCNLGEKEAYSLSFGEIIRRIATLTSNLRVISLKGKNLLELSVRLPSKADLKNPVL